MHRYRKRPAVYCAIVATVLTQFASEVVGQEAIQTLTMVEQVHQVPAPSDGQHYKIDIECIVTCCEPDWPILFVFDGTHGFYVGNYAELEQLTAGDRIRLRGELKDGSIPVNTKIERSENAVASPVAKVVSFDWLQAGNEDSQFVELDARLVGVGFDNSQICLEMRTQSGGRFRGLIHHSKLAESKAVEMLGQTLRLKGIVGGRFSDRQDWTGFQLWLSDPGNIQSLETNDVSNELPIHTIGELNSELIVETSSTYFRTIGIATYQISASVVLIQDASSHIFAELHQSQVIELDRDYEVSGSLDTGVEPPVIRMARFQPSEKPVTPPQSSVRTSNLSQLTSGDFGGQIVSICGNYVGQFSASGQPGMLIESEGKLAPVFFFNESMESISRGTKVIAAGVWVHGKSLENFNLGAFSLHARRRDIQLGAQIPWWLFSWLGLSAAIALTASTWAVSLRKQVRRRTQQFVDSVAKQREIEQRMTAMQKMESLGVLAGGIAHDFNNLLAVISGSTNLLDNSKLSAEERNHVTRIEDATQRAAELTQQMLAYAGQGRFEIRVANLSQIVSEISTLLNASVEKGTQLRLELDTGIQGIQCDATQIKQVLMNLVRNASEAIVSGKGTVTVRTRRLSEIPLLAEDALALNFLSELNSPQNLGFVGLEVSDDGNGIESSLLKNIFDPFFTTKFPGRGLGLSTVMGIVRSHNCCMHISSRSGGGTTFSIYFPAFPSPTAEQESVAKDQTPTFDGLSVVLVDDEPSILKVLTMALQRNGVHVLSCYNGEDALQMLQDENFKVDCLVTDQTMPTMSGLELCRHVRNIRPELPVILCSGYSLEISNNDHHALGITAVLQKPFSPRQLLELISRCSRSTVNDSSFMQQG